MPLVRGCGSGSGGSFTASSQLEAGELSYKNRPIALRLKPHHISRFHVGISSQKIPKMIGTSGHPTFSHALVVRLAKQLWTNGFCFKLSAAPVNPVAQTSCIKLE